MGNYATIGFQFANRALEYVQKTYTYTGTDATQTTLINATHDELRAKIVKIAMGSIFIGFLAFETVPAIIGVAVGAGLGVYISKSTNPNIVALTAKVSAIWNCQPCRETISLICLSALAFTVIVYPPISALTSSFGIGAAAPALFTSASPATKKDEHKPDTVTHKD